MFPERNLTALQPKSEAQPCPASMSPDLCGWRRITSSGWVILEVPGSCELERIPLGYKRLVSVKGRSIGGPPRRRCNVLWRLSFHFAGRILVTSHWRLVKGQSRCSRERKCSAQEMGRAGFPSKTPELHCKLLIPHPVQQEARPCPPSGVWPIPKADHQRCPPPRILFLFPFLCSLVAHVIWLLLRHVEVLTLFFLQCPHS